MTKVWDKPITADTDWGGDASTGGLPVSGRIVQEFIKDTLASIASAIKTDEQLEDLIKSYLDEKGITSDEGFVTLATEQIIKAVKDFEKGLKINGSPLIEYDAEKDALFLPTNLVVRGAITMFGDKGTTVPSIWASFPYDNETIKFNETTGKFYAVGGGSGGLDIQGVRDIIEGYEYVTTADVDDKLKLYVDKTYVEDYFVSRTIAQDIKVRHDFTDGLKIEGLPMYKSKEDTIFLDANLVLRGSLTMFGKDTTTTPSIFDLLPIDNETIKRNENGQLYAVAGGTGGGVADSVAWSNITDKPTWIGREKPSYSYSEILETPDLGGFVTTESLTESLSGKADSATTLAGYGITDAYTKKAVDDALAKYVLLDTAQSISAIHDFTNGLLIDGLAIKKSQDKTIYIDGNLVVSGAMTMFGKDSTIFPTIWANIPFNPDHMTWDGSQWSVVGGGGASVTKDAIVSALGYTPLSITGGTITGDLTLNGSLKGLSSIKFSALGDNGITYGNYGNPKLGAMSHDWTVYGSDGTVLLQVVPSGNVRVKGGVSASSFSGNLAGNADSATTLKTSTGYLYARAFNVDKIVNIGADATFQGYDTYIDGNSIRFRYGSANATAMEIQADGVVSMSNMRVSNSVTVNNYLTTSTLNVFSTTSVNPISIAGKNAGGALGFGSYNGSSYTRYGLITIGESNGKLIRYDSSFSQGYTILDSSGGTVNGNLTANRYYANNGFILTNVGDEYSGLAAGKTISSSSNAKDIWLYNSASAIKVYTPSTFSVVKGNVAIGGETADEKLHVYGNVKATKYIGSLQGVADYAMNLSCLPIDQPIDLNNLSYPLIWFYGQNITKTNFPSGFLYGGVLNLITSGGSLNGQLAWDITHNSTTAPTRKLYWRASNNNGFRKDWHEIVFRDDTELSPSSRLLTVNGQVLTTDAITMFSQASLKNIINREGLSLDELSRIRPARFMWKDGRDVRVHVGAIADEIVEVLPEVVYFTGEEKTMTMDYASAGHFIATSLIKPVVNHDKLLIKHDATIKVLRERVQYLESKLKQYNIA